MFLKQLNLASISRLCAIAFMAAVLLQSAAWLAGDSSGFITSVYAEEEKKKKLTKAEKEAKLKYKNAVSQRRKSVGTTCAKRLTKVQEITQPEEGEPDWALAEAELKSAFKRGCRPGFEYSQLNRYLGYVYYAQDKIELAIEAYLALVNEPEADEQQRV